MNIDLSKYKLFLKIQKTLRVTYMSEIYLGTINFNLINNEYLKTLLPKKTSSSEKYAFLPKKRHQRNSLNLFFATY